MSHWTYIRGTFNAQLPFQSGNKDRIIAYIEWAIKMTRRNGFDITGSEGPVKFFVNPPVTPSSFSSEDGETFNYGFVTVIGSLRDREDDQTIGETQKFLAKLQQFMELTAVHIRVKGDYSTPIEAVYPNYEDLSFDEYDKYEAQRDKLWRIRHFNCQRFYDNVVADFRKCCEIAEILHNLSPKGREGLLDNFGIERLIDWDYNDRYKTWYEGQFERKIPEPDYDRSEKWAWKKTYPKKPTIAQVIDEVLEFAYGDKKHDFSQEEHEKLRVILESLRKVQSREEDKNEIEEN